MCERKKKPNCGKRSKIKISNKRIRKNIVKVSTEDKWIIKIGQVSQRSNRKILILYQEARIKNRPSDKVKEHI